MGPEGGQLHGNVAYVREIGPTIILDHLGHRRNSRRCRDASLHEDFELVRSHHHGSEWRRIREDRSHRSCLRSSFRLLVRYANALRCAVHNEEERRRTLSVLKWGHQFVGTREIKETEQLIVNN